GLRDGEPVSPRWDRGHVERARGEGGEGRSRPQCDLVQGRKREAPGLVEAEPGQSIRYHSSADESDQGDPRDDLRHEVLVQVGPTAQLRPEGEGQAGLDTIV